MCRGVLKQTPGVAPVLATDWPTKAETFAGAKAVVSIGGDFMSEGPNALKHAREFAATRRVTHAGDEMSRLYVAESKPSEAGSMADHRFRVAPSDSLVYVDGEIRVQT